MLVFFFLFSVFFGLLVITNRYFESYSTESVTELIKCILRAFYRYETEGYDISIGYGFFKLAELVAHIPPQ